METPTSILTRTQPLHVVYGGAHLFKSGTCAKLGDLARRSIQDYDVRAALDLPGEVEAKLLQKLEREPIEDFRIDFEDGFGARPDEEEDAEAARVAGEVRAAVAAQSLPAFFGLRIKNSARGLRTLQMVLDAVTAGGAALPERFVITLPKISAPDQVAKLAKALEPYPNVGIEIMVETPQAIYQLPQLVAAAGGRARAAHLGAYDYLASLGIATQELHHPACDFARNMMQTMLAGSGVALSDGATQRLPLPVHRGACLGGMHEAENRVAVHEGWRIHFENVRTSLYKGFYQSWDLHPAQIPPHFAAVFLFYMDGLAQSTKRLESFVAAAAKTSQVGGHFDDAATGRGLLNYFERALACGLAEESRGLVEELDALLT